MLIERNCRFSGTASENGTEQCVKRNLVPLFGLYSRCKQVCTGSPFNAELRLRSHLGTSGKKMQPLARYNHLNRKIT